MKHHCLGKAAIWWCMASYIYYHRPELPPIMSDKVFDEITKYLKDNIDEVRQNDYGHGLVTLSRLQAGSGFDIPKDKYPLVCRHNAVQVVKLGETYY